MPLTAGTKLGPYQLADRIKSWSLLAGACLLAVTSLCSCEESVYHAAPETISEILGKV